MNQVNQIMRANGLQQAPTMPMAKAILKPTMTQPLSLRLLAPDPCLLRRLLEQEKDERYRYLIKHGQVYGVDAETSTIYVELP